jgi:hypothetical protein
LEVLIGKRINVGKTEPMGDEPPLDITTSDIYEWLPGKVLDPCTRRTAGSAIWTSAVLR